MINIQIEVQNIDKQKRLLNNRILSDLMIKQNMFNRKKFIIFYLKKTMEDAIKGIEKLKEEDFINGLF
jgi:hypothetical protein